MQRTGRINRIGSVAGVIYNYNFYPSKHGDDEIKLYKNALIKLQGFHTAFGEDAQVFTHEELVEQFELFKEGMPNDEDKRLQYLRFIREFKDLNPREFKRIKNFPLKARTARKNSVLENENIKDSTLVFLKSPYKMEFYYIGKDKKVSSLTFLEAAEIFVAEPKEVGYEIPPVHYEHVQKALDEFDNDFLGSSTEVVTTTDKADAISAQAKKFLRDFKGITRNNEVKKACDALMDLIDKGTYTPLPNEIRKLKKQLDKKTITYGQADNLIIGIAKKFDAVEDEQESTTYRTEIEANITPEIVITETFTS